MQDQESDQKESLALRPGSSLESLKSNLLKKWTEKKIDICYQNAVLAYLSPMGPEEAKLQIINEQQKLLSNRCPAIKIQHWKAEREQIMAGLLQKLQDEKEIQDACQSIDQLRKINLKICEGIFVIRQEMEKNQPKSSAVFVGYGKLFEQLNTSNIPITKSYMRNYISFTSSYDPFFLHPYERIEAEGFPEDTPEPVAKLFKMNISYVYRLIKARNQLIKCLSQFYTETEDSNLGQRDYGLSEQQKEDIGNEKSGSNSKYLTTSGKKKVSLSVHARKYQTIQPGEQGSPETKRKFRRRLQIKSEPKSSKRQQELIKTEQEEGNERKNRKFKIRQQGETLRYRTENYEITEDEDINYFRKKMMARREKRRKITITDRRQSQSEQEMTPPTNKKTLQLARKIPPSFGFSESLIEKNKKAQQLEQVESSSEEEPMEPRGLEDNNSLNRRIGKLKLMEPSRIRQSIRKRKQKIKLEPIKQFAERLQAQEKKDLSRPKYYPTSPQIKEMNKQSSSSNSDKKLSESDEAYTGKRQDELYLNVSKCEQQKNGSAKALFRIKKVPHESEARGFSEKSIWVQSQEFQPIEETQQRFQDGHIRSSNGQQEQLMTFRETGKKPSNVQITKKLQSPSRLQFRPIQSTNHSRLHDHTSRQKYNNQEKSKQSIQKETSQKILKEMQEQMQEGKKKQIKMKPGQIKLADLYAFIQQQKINQFQRQQFQVGLWKQNINLKHSYLTKFYMNSELAAFGISSPRCDGDYNILYWGTTCADSFTTFLFRKYLDYLQKFTNLNNIYIGSPGYSDADFQKKGSSFVRGRKKHQKRELPYIPFLSLQCSNICFEQKTSPQLSIFFSQQIQQFTVQNSKPNKFIAFCNPQDPTIKLPEKSEFHKNINSIYEVNSILQKLGIDTYATSQKIRIKDCKVFTLKDNCTIKSNYFYVRDGYFVPKGLEIYSKQKQKILKLQMSKDEYFIYFGKKFQNVDSFLNLCSPKVSGPSQFFAFKMFSKQLYGRIKNNEFANTGCYGNWDINFLWQDQLKGTVIKDMPSPDYIFGPQKFHVAIFKAQVLLFGFQVKPSDFFF